MPRPRPAVPELRIKRGKYAIVWWRHETRHLTSTGTSDIERAQQLLEQFRARSRFWDYARTRRRPAKTDDMIYVIGSSVGHHKIGVSKTPDVRVETLQNGHPHKLALVKAWPAAPAFAKVAEKRAHALLSQRRMEGEWFDVPHNVACAAVELALEMDPYSSRDRPTPRK